MFKRTSNQTQHVSAAFMYQQWSCYGLYDSIDVSCILIIINSVSLCRDTIFYLQTSKKVVIARGLSLRGYPLSSLSALCERVPLHGNGTRFEVKMAIWLTRSEKLKVCCNQQLTILCSDWTGKWPDDHQESFLPKICLLKSGHLFVIL